MAAVCLLVGCPLPLLSLLLLPGRDGHPVAVEQKDGGRYPAEDALRLQVVGQFGEVDLGRAVQATAHAVLCKQSLYELVLGPHVG